MTYKAKLKDNALSGFSYTKHKYGTNIFTFSRDQYTDIPESLANILIQTENHNYIVINTDEEIKEVSTINGKINVIQSPKPIKQVIESKKKKFKLF